MQSLSHSGVNKTLPAQGLICDIVDPKLLMQFVMNMGYINLWLIAQLEGMNIVSTILFYTKGKQFVAVTHR